MNRSKIAIGVMASLSMAAGTAHAELLVAKGKKATVTVEFVHAAVGSKRDKHDPREWKVNRSATVTAIFEAQKPQALAQMRALEDAQMADIKQKQTTAMGVGKKMAPMMSDMLKIVDKCGETNEACIEKEIEAYGNSMEMTPELKSASKDIDKLAKVDGPRYQLWKLVSQEGTYSVDEYYKGQIADPVCLEKPGARCHRQETRKGNGRLTPVKNGAGQGMFEVDAQKKDIVIILPALMSVPTYSRNVASDFPGESSGTSQGVVTHGLGESKPITVAIPLDLKKLSGIQELKQNGAEGESGMLTVRWTIAVP